MAVFPKKWSFDLKNLGSFVVQKAGKFGRLQVTRLQIYYGVTQAETTLFSFEELQSFDLPMTRFPFLLHHKGALIFQIKRPLFWKNGQICPSLAVVNVAVKKDTDDAQMDELSKKRPAYHHLPPHFFLMSCSVL